MLSFIGNGSAFNTSRGNTSAFLLDNNSLVLIDCGSMIFHNIIRLNLLKNIKNLHIIITHTHADHIGSLGDLVFYSHYIIKILPTVYFPDKTLMKTYLQCVGIKDSIVNINSSMEATINVSSNNDLYLSFVPTIHVSNIPSFGFTIDYRKTKLYYSGDSKEIPESILAQLNNNELDYFIKIPHTMSIPTSSFIIRKTL